MRPDALLRNNLQEATFEYAAQVGEAEAYLESRGIPLSVAMDYKLGVVTAPYLADHTKFVGRLSIPYVTRTGIYTVRFRCLQDHNCKDAHCPKYLSVNKVTMPLYNVESLFTRGDQLVVTEGEIDALVCTALVGVPAVGLPGANGWKPYFAACLADFREVIVVGDGDKAGREMVDALTDELPNARGVVLDDGHDINSLYLAEGAFGVMSALGVV